MIQLVYIPVTNVLNIIYRGHGPSQIFAVQIPSLLQDLKEPCCQFWIQLSYIGVWQDCPSCSTLRIRNNLTNSDYSAVLGQYQSVRVWIQVLSVLQYWMLVIPIIFRGEGLAV